MKELKREKKTKLSLIADDMIVHMENEKNLQINHYH